MAERVRLATHEVCGTWLERSRRCRGSPLGVGFGGSRFFLRQSREWVQGPSAHFLRSPLHSLCLKRGEAMVKTGTKTVTHRRKTNTVSFNTYIARVLRQVQPSFAPIASGDCSSREHWISAAQHGAF